MSVNSPSTTSNRCSGPERGAFADPPGDQWLFLEQMRLLRDVYPAAKEISRPRRERGTGGDPPLRQRLIVKRVFLADGDALVLPTRRLLAVLQAIRQHLPEVERVSSYCLPRNLRRKSVDELRELADAGLRMAYVGAESGDDEVLARVNKGETYSSTLDALEKLGEAGISRSVMILNGLGGMTLSAQHADNSARLMNAAQPEYLSTLVVSFPTGEQRFRAGFADFEALDRRALFVEVERLLQGLELEDTVFRSDHASNYLVLKGELGADKARLLAEVRQAIEQPQHAALRQEWQRGL